jgi:hypothetical protein
VLLSCLICGYCAYAAELQQRLAFLHSRQRGGDGDAGWEQPPQPGSRHTFWPTFALPATAFLAHCYVYSPASFFVSVE